MRIDKMGDVKFCDIVDSIAPYISGLYWVLDGVDFSHHGQRGQIFSEYQDSYESVIIAEANGVRLGCLDFLLKYSQYIVDDWWDLKGVAVTGQNELERLTDDDAIIVMKCIDAAFWELAPGERCDKVLWDKIVTDLNSKFSVSP